MVLISPALYSVPEHLMHVKLCAPRICSLNPARRQLPAPNKVTTGNISDKSTTGRSSSCNCRISDNVGAVSGCWHGSSGFLPSVSPGRYILLSTLLPGCYTLVVLPPALGFFRILLVDYYLLTFFVVPLHPRDCYQSKNEAHSGHRQRNNFHDSLLWACLIEPESTVPAPSRVVTRHSRDSCIVRKDYFGIRQDPAQWLVRFVRNEEAGGPSPLSSSICCHPH